MDNDINYILEAIAAEKEIQRKEALGNHLTGDRRPDAAFRQQYGVNWRVEAKPKKGKLPVSISQKFPTQN